MLVGSELSAGQQSALAAMKAKANTALGYVSYVRSTGSTSRKVIIPFTQQLLDHI